MSVPGTPPSGLLLIDKPAGVTSFQVVNQVRKVFVQADSSLQKKPRRGKGGRPPRFKCGHAGTLDPLATGLLLVLVGKGSRLSHFLLGLDKSYAATVRFGQETDSLDSDGLVTATAPVPESGDALRAVLPEFVGDLQQVPPLISALKQDGQALHRRVRAGQEVAPPPPRPVRIASLELADLRWPGGGEEPAADARPDSHSHAHPDIPPEADLVVCCSSGTYIRSLARDVARAAGTVGHITALRRLTVGPFSVDDALTDIMSAGQEELRAALRPLSDALPQVPALVLDPRQEDLVLQGGQPLPGWLDGLESPAVAVGKAGRLFKMVGSDGCLVAVGRLETDEEGVELPRLAAVIPRPSRGSED